MKKTLITALFALSGTAFAASTESYTLTTTANEINQADIAGWVESLDSSLLTPSAALPASVNLDSLSIETPDRASNSVPAGTSIKIAVYTYTPIDSLGTLLGVSSTASFATNSTLTFNFSDVVLDTDKAYRFSFWTADSSEEEPSFHNFRMKLTKLASDAGEGIIGSDGQFAIQEYSPYVSYSVSSVPEPATATLSLLALAGLAARRRRK